MRSMLSTGVETSNRMVWFSLMTTISPSSGRVPPNQVVGEDHTSR